MRWIVMSLLLANAGWFVWHWLLPSPPLQAAETATAAGVVRLQMPHELVSNAPQLPVIETAAPTAERTVTNLVSAPVSNAAPAAGESAAVPAPELVTQCWATPWSSSDDNLAGWTQQAEQASRQSRDQPAGETWLVYLPAKGSRDQMLTRLRDLKSLKIESAFINAGEQAGGVSLGLFSRKESADKRLGEARSLGLQDAQVKARPRLKTEHRLTTTGTVAPGTDWQTLPCADVAHSGKPL